MISCKNPGCMEKFNLPMQMYRHLAKCTFPPLEVDMVYTHKDGKFECNHCQSSFSRQSSVIRHCRACPYKKK